MPIVNKTLRAIRNFGRVTTARDYKPDQIEVKPEDRLRAWKALGPFFLGSMRALKEAL